jgi:hypothetical protein
VRLDHLLLGSDLLRQISALRKRRCDVAVSQLRLCSNPVRRTAKSSGLGREEVPGCAEWESSEEGRPASGSGNLLKIETHQAISNEVTCVARAASLSTLQGSRACARTESGAASVGSPARRHSPAGLFGAFQRAFSSVGESARLITVRSVVRIHKGPRAGNHA